MANESKKLTQEQIQNIENYGDEIHTLKDFVEAVRLRPGMYIGYLGNRGFINMTREIFQNAYDELNRDSSPCDCVTVTFDERTFTTVIEDNGRGIPFGHMIRIFQSQHTSSNYEKKKGDYSSGLHGVGSKVTNALSSFFKIESYNSIIGEARVVEFHDGYPWNKGEQKIPNPNNKQGTVITFVPDLKVLGDLSVTWMDVFQLVDMLMPLSKKGSKCIFNAIDYNGKKHTEVVVNEDGIFKFIVNMTEHPLIMPISLYRDNGNIRMDFMFTYDTTEMDNETIMAFANSCPTVGGFHIDTFKDSLASFFTNYMNKVYLVNSSGKRNKDLKVTAADTRVGLKAVLSVALLEPIFSGQAKEILGNDTEEDIKFIKDGMLEGLDAWSKNNPKDFAKICKYLKDVAELRLKQDKEKVNLNKKYNSNALTGLPSKYVAPNGKKNLELWIVEGDSAAGTIKNHRDTQTQGYFPIRGKMPNAFEKSSKEFLDNAEVAGIINIIGGGYGRNFDISKVKWEKIVFGVNSLSV